ncbi:MAG: aminotransferase class I/II-fold pyridoxal phosphate-dependent enzyme [Prevotella sp.]|nr:aminotransferase class I/II-fold pyridoxal phosphate-dependent enzyme [Prevotella sp.]
MQAILLAAGMGKRLGEHTKDNTKCMVEVNGVRLIDRVIQNLAGLGLSRLVIVIGYEGRKLTDYIGHRYDDVLTIEYIENPIYDKTNNIYSLALAKDVLCSDDTILLESDLIYDADILQLLVGCPDPNVALVARYEPWMDGTMVQIDDNRNIVNFVSKSAFDYSQTESYYKTVNIYKFSKEFSQKCYVPFLEAYCKVMGNNEYYEQVLSVISHVSGSMLKALPISNERWYEIDDIQDLDIASCIFSDDAHRLQQYHRRYGGFWRFPDMLDYCYLVNPYFPSSRMIEEMKCSFETLLRNYPSGMSVNSLLAAKMFGVRQEYITVGNGAAELIKSLMDAITGNIGVVFPTFEEYSNRKAQSNLIVYQPDNPDFAYTAADLMAYFDDKDISTLLVINPDNPSGNFIPAVQLLQLCQWAKSRGVRIIIDESFVDFTDECEANSLLHDSVLAKYDNLVVVKSISKSYGVPGLRLGVVATSDVALADTLKKDVAIWNINSFAEYYMQIYGKYSADYACACRLFVNERKRFFGKLQQIPFLRVIPSQANYFLAEVLPPYSSSALSRRLLNRHNILIKDCSAKKGFGGAGYIRLAIRNTADNDKLLSALNNL